MGLSFSPILAEAKDSADSVIDGMETVSSESEMSSCITTCSSTSDDSEADVPSKSLFIADFAASQNHSSSGSALQKC